MNAIHRRGVPAVLFVAGLLTLLSAPLASAQTVADEVARARRQVEREVSEGDAFGGCKQPLEALRGELTHLEEVVSELDKPVDADRSRYLILRYDAAKERVDGAVDVVRSCRDTRTTNAAVLGGVVLLGAGAAAGFVVIRKKRGAARR